MQMLWPMTGPVRPDAGLPVCTMSFVLTEWLGAVVDDFASVTHRHGFSIPRRITISIDDPHNLRDLTAPIPLLHMTTKGVDKQSFFAAHIWPVKPHP